MKDFVDCYQNIDGSDAFKDYMKRMALKALDFYCDYYQCERGMVLWYYYVLIACFHSHY